MAVYTTPTETHEHYVERDTGSGSGIWAVVAVLIVLFALLFFGTRLFGTRTSTTPNTGGANIQTPSTDSGASGSTNGSASGTYNP